MTVFSAWIFGIVALTATQWSQGKTAFSNLTALLPQYEGYPGVEGLFNANEIAGGMIWIAPLLVGIARYFRHEARLTLQKLALGAAALLYIALILGQSLSALIGLAIATAVVLVPRTWWKAVSTAAVAFILIAQVVIMVNPNSAVAVASVVSGRENLNSLIHREVIWTSARQAVLDHPFTGLGVALFRDRQTWNDYPTPGFDRWTATHAHNEILHIGTDLGIPGIAFLLSWYATVAYMLYQAQRQATDATHALIAGVSAGLIAHAIYGLGDAIPLWDRFAFLFWWMIGLASGLYVVQRAQPASEAEITPTN